MITILEGEHHTLDDEGLLPYKYLSKLGSGGCGMVEKVEDQTTNLVYARKTVQISSRRRKQNLISMYQNEVAIIHRLRPHHHFIRVYATYITPDEFALILLPVADKGDLSRYLSAYRRSSDSVSRQEMQNVLKRSFGCLTTGLAFMHAQKVRHKDIKPHNILVHEGKIIYTDFGYSLDHSELSTSRTYDTSNGFTEWYSAPEVKAKEPRDSRSDVWSLGCVMLEILAALTDAFQIDEEIYATAMTELHGRMSAAHRPDEYSHIFDIVIEMTCLAATGRPRSGDLAARVLKHSGFGCDDCSREQREHQLKLEDALTGLDQSSTQAVPAHAQPEITLSTLTPWVWSPEHEDWYTVQHDAYGRPECIWSKAQGGAHLDVRKEPRVAPGMQAGPDYTGNEAADAVNTRLALDNSYFARFGVDARRFFTVGRVFAMLYTEPAGAQSAPNSNDDAYSWVRFNVAVYAQVRRFIVMEMRRGFVYAWYVILSGMHGCTLTSPSAISTYGRRGTTKPGCNPSEHAIAYFSETNPDHCYLEGEYENGMLKSPIEIIPADNTLHMHPSSRIRFSKTYPVETNVKVKDVGQVSPKHVGTLLSYYAQYMH